MADKTHNDLSDGDEDPTENFEDELTELDSIIRKDLFDNLDEMATPMKLTRQSVEHSREHMKVYLRVRPFTEKEVEQGESQECLDIDNGRTCIMRAPEESFAFKNSVRTHRELNHKFTFTNIFKAETSQKKFFDETMLGVVKDFVDGQNCLVFTYGVTNAGKTYTIQGVPQDEGILPRSLDVVFNSIEGKQYSEMALKPRFFSDVVKLTDKQIQKELEMKQAILKLAEESKHDNDGISILSETNISANISKASDTTVGDESNFNNTTSIQDETTKDSDALNSIIEDLQARIPDDTSVDVEAQGPVKFSVWVSFAEIYNEYIYDLLEPMPKGKKARRQTLKLSEDKNGSIYIKGLKEIQISSADEAYKVLTIGQKNQRIASTKLNHCSSRSHCIFSIKVLRVVDIENPHVARVSKLSFCDLAGSERYAKTQNTGDRLKEAGNINTSLLTLGKCITTLRYNQNHPKVQPKIIPFRESKLTRLFQSFFMGKGKASMIVNVNQCASMFDETMHVMKFSAIAKQVTTVTSKLDNRWKEVAFPKPASARNMSLAIRQGPIKDRATIGWATPSHDVSKKAIHEIVIDEEEEEEDDEMELVEICGDSSTEEGQNEKMVQLMSIIDNLKKALIVSKQEMAIMEVKVREEVCQEMAQQLVDIESTYSERLKEERLIVEEKCDKRIEMYTQSVKKTRKRARIDKIEDEEDEWVSSVLFHAEQVKVQEREAKIRELTTLLGAMKADLNDLKDKTKKPMFGAPSSDSAVIDGLNSQIADHKETIMSQQNEITDLQEMLTEAGETFHQQNGEIEKLKIAIAEYEDKMKIQDEAIKELEKGLQENTKVVEEANLKLKTKAEYIQEIEKQLEKATESSGNLPELQNQLTTLQSQLHETQTSLEKKTNELESLQKVNDVTSNGKRDSDVNILRNRIASLEHKLQEAKDTIEEFEMRVPATDSTALFEFNEMQVKVELSEEKLSSVTTKMKQTEEHLRKELSEKEEAVKEWEAKAKQVEDALTITSKKCEDLEQQASKSDDNKTVEIANLKEEKNVFEMEIQQMRSAAEENKNKILKLETSISDYQTALNDNENFLEQMNKQEKQLKTELESEKKACNEVKEDVKVLQSRVKQLVQNVAELEQEGKAAEMKTNELNKLRTDSKSQIEELVKKILELQQEVTQYENKLTEKEQEVIDTLRNSENQKEDGTVDIALEEELQNVRCQLESMVQNSTDAVDEIKKELSAKIEQIKELEEQLGQVNQRRDESENELQSTKEALEAGAEKATVQQQKVEKLETELMAAKEELKGKMEEIAVIEAKLASAKTSENELENRLGCELEKLKVAQELAVKLQEENENLKNEVTKAGESLEVTKTQEANLISKYDGVMENFKALQEKEHSNEKTKKKLEDELEDAKKTITDLEDECKRLKEEEKELNQMKMKDSELKKELRAANRKARKAEEQMKEQEETVKKIQKRLKFTEDSLADAMKDAETLEKKLKDRESQVDQDKKSAEKQINCLQETIEKEKESAGRFEKEITLGKEREQELVKVTEELKERNEKLNGDYTNMNSKYLNLDAEYERVQATFQTVTQKCDKMTLTIEDQARKIEKLNQQVEKSKELLEVKEKELVDLQAVSTLYEQLHNKHAILETQTSELQQFVKSSTEAKARLQDDLDKLNREFAEETIKKDDDLDQLNKELERAKVSLQGLEDLRKDLDKANTRESEARQGWQEVCVTLNERNHTIEKHSSTIQKLEEKVERLEEQDEGGLKTAKEHEEKIEQLTEERDSLQNRIRELEKVFEEKEDKVKSKSTTIKKLMSKIKELSNLNENQVKAVDIAKTDVKHNEQLIESLKCAIEEQESTMAQQDAVLNTKEEELQKSYTDLEELQDKHSSLLKSSNEQQRTLKKTESELEKTIAKNEKLKENDSQKNEELEKVKKTAEKMEAEKRELEESAKRHLEEVETLEMQLKNSQAELADARGKNENRERSSETSNSSEEVDKLKQIMKEMQAEKDKELTRWRNERDKLVAALEKEMTALAKREKNLLDQLKERDCHITELIAQLEKETTDNLTDDESDKIEELEKKLKAKEEMITALQKVDVSSVGSQRATRNHGGRSTRRGTAATTSATDDVLAKEIESLRKELNTEKNVHEKSCKAVEAKEHIIGDLKAANIKLQTQLSLMEDQAAHGTVTSDVKVSEEMASSPTSSNTCDEVVSTPVFDNDKNQSLHMEIDVTPLQKKQTRRNTRATKGSRKRKGTEVSEEGQENVKQSKQEASDVPAKITRRTGRRGKVAKEPESEVLSPSKTDNVNVKMEQATTFSKFGDYLQNSPFGKSASNHSSAKKFLEATGLTAQPELLEPESPPRPPPQDKRRGKKKLYKTDISAPLELPYESMQATSDNKAGGDTSHNIVARRLRSRTVRK
ncbi:uncharacterized protein LOC144446196 [Glandiceps talaboti]